MKTYGHAIDGRCIDASRDRLLLLLSTLLRTATGNYDLPCGDVGLPRSRSEAKAGSSGTVLFM